MIFSLFIGGLTQRHLEDWNFILGIYVWFATFSTIGYGDYVPAWKLLRNLEASESSRDSATHINLWLVISAMALPVLAGLSVVSGVLNSLVEALEEFRIQFNVRSKCSKCVRKKPLKLRAPNQSASPFGKGLSQGDHSLTTLKRRVRSSTF